MSYKLKGLDRGIFYLTLIIIPWPSVQCEIIEEIAALQLNDSVASLGEYCLDKICQERQFCDINSVCNCLPGYRVQYNDCVLFAGENEKCTHREDCIGNLICFKGICRKPPFDDFAVLAKICLGITVTAIIVAAFSSLLKCLMRYDSGNPQSFQRQNDNYGPNFTPAYTGNVFSSRPPLYDVREEKPPSYEECIRSSDPPPYTISSNAAMPPVESLRAQPMINLTTIPQDETPLNVQNLNQKISSK